MRGILLRTTDNGEQTNGYLTIFNEAGDFVAGFNTLELPYKGNQRRVSCIPIGFYTVRVRTASESANFKYTHFQIENVPDRSHILIHVGNYVHQLLGCVAIGQPGVRFDINRDGKLDISNSGKSLKALLEVCPDGFELEIMNAFI